MTLKINFYFTFRYIACLRGKLHSENLLRLEGEGGGVDGDEGGYESNGSNGSATQPFNLDNVPSYNSRRGENIHHTSSRPNPQMSYAQSSHSSSDEEEGNAGVGGDAASNPSAKVKRGVLPRKATSVLRSWLFQHLVHPYPTEDEKRQLATQTKLTLLQVHFFKILFSKVI